MSSTPPPPTTFTQMADTDLEAIGRNCQYEFCGQLDFLPFRCESCKGTYCLEHRTETAHKCTHPGEWARRKRETSAGTPTAPTVKSTVYNSDQCSHPQCKLLINTPTSVSVHCDKCNRNYCLQHRLREGHDCANLIPLGARAGGGRASDNSATIRSMFSKLRGLGKDIQAPKAPKITLPASIQYRRATTSRTSAIAQLNEMKRKAKGEASIPVDKRIYLHVVGTTDKPTSSEEPPSGDFFFDSRWKVGRVLDDAARKLKVQNLNNRGGGEEARLRVFHVDSGAFLEFSDQIGGDGSKVKSGHTIVLLRGAGVLLGN